MILFVFFFKQKTAYEMRISDWSSDVCSSDLRPRRLSGERRACSAVRNQRAVKSRRGRSPDLQESRFAAGQSESASLRWVARSCWRTRWNSLATRATATAGRSSDCWRAPISMRLAAADSDIAPRLALDDFSECAASRRAGRSEEHTSELQSLMRNS